MDKNTHYFVTTGDYLDDVWYDVQSYFYDVIKPSKEYTTSAPVKTSKLVAKKLGMRSSRADTFIVDESALQQLQQQFNFDGKTLGALRVADAGRG